MRVFVPFSFNYDAHFNLVPSPLQRSMPQEAPCMRFAIENRIADILENFPNGLHVDEIVSKTENKINPRKLGRIMRLLATRGCFREGE